MKSVDSNLKWKSRIAKLIPKLNLKTRDHDMPFRNPVRNSDKSEIISMATFLHDKHIDNSLEIGMGDGGMSACILTFTGTKLTSIDPDQTTEYADQGRKNLKKVRLAKHHNFIENSHWDSLPELESKGRKFEFIYIHNDRRFDYVLFELYYSDLLLSSNGHVAIASCWRPSVKRAIQIFISERKDCYSEVNSLIKGTIFLKKFSDHK